VKVFFSSSQDVHSGLSSGQERTTCCPGQNFIIKALPDWSITHQANHGILLGTSWIRITQVAILPNLPIFIKFRSQAY